MFWLSVCGHRATELCPHLTSKSSLRLCGQVNWSMPFIACVFPTWAVSLLSEPTGFIQDKTKHAWNGLKEGGWWRGAEKQSKGSGCRKQLLSEVLLAWEGGGSEDVCLYLGVAGGRISACTSVSIPSSPLFSSCSLSPCAALVAVVTAELFRVLWADMDEGAWWFGSACCYSSCSHLWEGLVTNCQLDRAVIETDKLGLQNYWIVTVGRDPWRSEDSGVWWFSISAEKRWTGLVH